MNKSLETVRERERERELKFSKIDFFCDAKNNINRRDYEMEIK